MKLTLERLKKSSMVTKAMLLILVFILVIGASVAGTLAWLTGNTETVKNTFTSAKFFDDTSKQFTLVEHVATDDNKDGRFELTSDTTMQGNEYLLLPGVNIPKDPTVIVDGLQSDAYLYIQVTGKLPDGLKYSIDANEWEPLANDEWEYVDVWVYKGSAASANHVIKASREAMVKFKSNVLTQTYDGKYGNYAIEVPTSYVSASDDKVALYCKAYLAQATGNGEDAVEAWVNTFNEGTKSPVTP